MSEKNELFFQQASELLSKIEIRYRQADFDEQVQLKKERDRAMALFSKARLAILKEGIICTDADVEQMQQLKQQIDSSTDILQVVATVAKFTSFVRLRFLL
ncbi:hypothetical protein [Leptolyngbya sp. GGD]|uniref:hypothetical protein n=1 Tax=Leptolyngbya sp. GGD TaxID=2997907 RepID=UPI00227AA4B2|nr:hypothetical protein [Leptolyngbya sp. GGD]MCY6489157.1 hypothetical protein [Leptolyngbya sp. GGD]